MAPALELGLRFRREAILDRQMARLRVAGVERTGRVVREEGGRFDGGVAQRGDLLLGDTDLARKLAKQAADKVKIAYKS